MQTHRRVHKPMLATINFHETNAMSSAFFYALINAVLVFVVVVRSRLLRLLFHSLFISITYTYYYVVGLTKEHFFFLCVCVLLLLVSTRCLFCCCCCCYCGDVVATISLEYYISQRFG